MAMTSKERVRCALQGGVPDRVPLGDFAIDYDTAERVLGHETYARAKARCRIAYWEGRRDEVVQSLVEDTVALYRKLDLHDLINLSAETLAVPPKGYRPEAPRRVDDVTWEYADGRVLKYSAATGDITMVHDPEQWTRELRSEDYPLEWAPAEPDPSTWELLDAVVTAFGRERFILGSCPLAAEWVQPGGMERGLIAMVEQPELVERALRSSLARAGAEQSLWRNRGLDGILDGTDWSYHAGPFMSPALWRRFCYPALAANVAFAHSQGLFFVQHACGNNWDLLGEFVRAGIDCYQSVQGSAGMDLLGVRAATGGRLALWGGVQVENLVSGSMEDVRRDVRQALAAMKTGGGFILGASHSIAVGTRYDNFMAMLDEFDRLRR
jgi:hypothetical protein